MARSHIVDHALAKRYNEQGPDRLGDRRQGNGAAPAILTPEARSSLKERLKTPPDDGGLWDGAESGALARQVP